MASWCPTPEPRRPHRRVRQEVKDGLAVFCSSLVASTVFAVALTLVTKLAS